MGYAAQRRPPDWSKRHGYGDATFIVPYVLADWLDWFRWHAVLAGYGGAIVGASRGVPEVGPRVVEALPVAPSFAAPEGGRVSAPPPPPSRDHLSMRYGDGPPGPASISPPDPGVVRRH